MKKSVFLVMLLFLAAVTVTAQQKDSITDKPILPLIEEPKGFDHVKIEVLKIDPQMNQGFGPRFGIVRFRHYEGAEPVSQIDVEKQEGRYYIDAKRSHGGVDMEHWYYMEVTEGDTLRYDALFRKFIE